MPSETLQFISEGDEVHALLFSPADETAPRGKAATSAVILCHDAFDDHESWVNYAQRLAEQGFAALVMDFVGHGSSEGRRGLVDMRRWAYNLRDAMNLLAKRGFRHFALVGCGSGGSAVLLAAAHDARVACAVTLAAAVQIMPPLSERLVFSLSGPVSKVRRLFKKSSLTLSRVESYSDMRFAVDDEVNEAIKTNPRFLELLGAVPVPESLDSTWLDITTAVKKIKIPVLILHGAEDKVVPVKQSEKLAALLTGHKRVCVVEGSGHALHLDQRKDEVYIELARWIKHHLTR